MLQQMRRFAGSWIASIFLGALAVSFAVWGIADIFTSKGDTTLAKVGDTELTPQNYDTQYQTLLRAEQNRTGHPISSAQAKQMHLRQHALDTLLADVALDNMARKYGLVTTDAQVTAYVHSISAFNGPLGNFDRNTFLNVLQQSGYTEQSFIQTVRADNMRQQINTAARNGTVLPEGYTHALLAYLNERRAVDYVTLPASAAGTAPTPDDATLTAYVKAHPERYSTPEYRDVTYAMIGPEDVANQVQVTDKQLHQEYDLRKADPQYAYVVPDKRDVEELTFKDEAGAKAAKAKIDAGTSFADVAKSLGMSPTNLGSVAKADLGMRGNAVFSLPVNGVTAPLKNLGHWELLHVTKITPGVNKTFDMVKDDLRKSVLDQLEREKVQEIDNAYTDANSGGKSLEEAAKQVGMKVVHIPAVDAKGLAPDGSKANVPDDPSFMDQVFKSDIGVEGDPFTTKDGKSFVVLVNGQQPPHLKPLSAVRAEATSAWQKEQLQKRLTEKAKELTARVNATHDLKAIAKEIGTTVQSSPALSRPTPFEPEQNGFTPDFLLKVFESKPDTVVYGPAKGEGGFVIAMITGVVHPPLPTFDMHYRQFRDEMNARAGGDLIDSLAIAAKNLQGVTLNQQQVSRVLDEGT